jgi:uncharacterized membrane protein
VKAKEFTAAVDKDRVVAAIRAAEARSAGEIRVHVSSRSVDDAQRAAVRVFEKEKMHETRERSGVLIFIAPPSRKFAVIGDRGIHARCGSDFWAEIARAMSADFGAGRFTDGIVKGVTSAGDMLAAHFPRSAERPDVNELSDDVSED